MADAFWIMIAIVVLGAAFLIYKRRPKTRPTRPKAKSKGGDDVPIVASTDQSEKGVKAASETFGGEMSGDGGGGGGGD